MSALTRPLLVKEYLLPAAQRRIDAIYPSLDVQRTQVGNRDEAYALAFAIMAAADQLWDAQS